MARTTAVDSERSAELAGALLDAFSGGTWDDTLCTDDATSWHNTDGEHAPLRDGMQRFGLIKNVIPDFGPADLAIRSWPSGFAIELTWSGTLPDGSPLRFPACIVGAVEGGRIASVREYIDSAHLQPLVAALTPAG